MRKCNCSGNCGSNNLTRRDFLGLVGAGAGAALLAGPAWAAFDLPADELERIARRKSVWHILGIGRLGLVAEMAGAE